MVDTTYLVEDLHALGIATPARPEPPKPPIASLEPQQAASVEHHALERAYRERCAAWSDAVMALHRQHCSAEG